MAKRPSSTSNKTTIIVAVISALAIMMVPVIAHFLSEKSSLQKVETAPITSEKKDTSRLTSSKKAGSNARAESQQLQSIQNIKNNNGSNQQNNGTTGTNVTTNNGNITTH